MQIILLENIRNLGNIGEIVKVKRGFARNYLIRQGKALNASKENIEIVKKKKDELNKKDLEKKQEAKKKHNAIHKKNGKTVKIKLNLETNANPINKPKLNNKK